MGCGCGGAKKSQAANLQWTVDVAGTGKTFDGGKTKMTFATPGEANAAIVRLGLVGKVRPRPATA